MVEITPHGHVVATKNVDRGAGAAIFGMVATGGHGDRDDTQLYFNDDDNTLKVLSRYEPRIPGPAYGGGGPARP